MYLLGQIIGLFFVMIVCEILAIIFAKKVAGWIILGIGSVVQLVSLFGIQKQAAIFGIDIFSYWVVYFLLLIVGIAVIILRRNKNNI